jgi:protein gp37
MSTKIEWTHVPDGKGGRKKGETINPLVGCSEVSPACRACYAAAIAARGMNPNHRGLTVKRSNGVHWNGQINRVPSQLEKPLRWRAPRGIFWGSMTDLWHESTMATEDGRRYIAACFGVMAATPQHTHMTLTKRPGEMRRWFEWLGTVDAGHVVDSSHDAWAVYDAMRDQLRPTVPDRMWRKVSADRQVHAWPLPNLWVGSTAEDQPWLDRRIDDLLATPAAVHYLSVEPMTGGRVVLPSKFLDLGKQAWVITGGESGTSARPSHPAWFRHLRDQCVEAGVPFLHKQNGAYAVVGKQANDTSTPAADSWTHVVTMDGKAYKRGKDTPLSVYAAKSTAFVRKVGKKHTGRLLDGVTWDQYPETDHD